MAPSASRSPEGPSTAHVASIPNATRSIRSRQPAAERAPGVASGRFEFPVGTVITKSFGFPADFRVANAPVKWTETRVLVRATAGWTGVSYAWDDAQKVATQMPGGNVDSFSFVDAEGNTQSPNYLVPSQAECQKCHANDGAMITLGPSASS